MCMYIGKIVNILYSFYWCNFTRIELNINIVLNENLITFDIEIILIEEI